MIIKSQIDIRGAIMASTDTSLLNYSRDAYAYCWPRDGGFVVWPLMRLGYQDEAQHFFAFCKKGMHPDGYLMHKYRADGALGSSWHPYIHDDIVAHPIQEDETALVVYIFSEFFSMFPSEQLIKDYYQTMIIPMVDFMLSYIDSRTGLPRPSYDLWEEDFITTTYTTSVVRAALAGAADVAETVGDKNNAVLWKTAADDMAEAAKNHLYNSERNFFYHGLNVRGKDVEKSARLDTSALFGAYIFGLFDPASEEIIKSIETLRASFIQYPAQPGIPRYENDNYRREHPEIQGNWWYISSLWHAQYMLANGDNEGAQNIINWIINTSSSSHLISEQYDPLSGKAVAPAPLTWSHAEFVSTLLDMIDKES
jgi:GH15 family glucan-1,4-alpha-glucosidase